MLKIPGNTYAGQRWNEGEEVLWRGGRAWFNALGWKPSGPSKAPQVRILSSPMGVSANRRSNRSLIPEIWVRAPVPLPTYGSFDYLDKSSGFHPEDRGFESHRTCQSTYAVLLLGQSGCSPMRIMAACGVVATGTPVRSRPRWCA